MEEFGIQLRKKAAQLKKSKDKILPSTIDKYGGYPIALIGCNESEITSIMEIQGVTRLPEIYLSYLMAMGKQSGDINLGEGMDYVWLSSLKKHLVTRIAAVNLKLPTDAFVFKGSQGVAYWYFITDNTDNDPPVYFWSVYYSDGEQEGEFNDLPPQQAYTRLSEFLTLFIAEREGEVAQREFLRTYTSN